MTTTIYLDTETGPSTRPDVLTHFAEKYHALRSPEDAERADKAYRETSLSGVFGELWVISFALNDGEPITLVRDDRGERDLLQRFATEMFAIITDFHAARRLKIVAHNAEFDRGMLRCRAIRHGVRLPPDIHGEHAKPWERAWYCTMDALKSGWKSGVSLDEACLAFEIPLRKGDITGKNVWEAICAGRLAEVAEYCADDVRRVRAVYQQITTLWTLPPEPVDEGAVRRIMAQMGAPKGES